MLTLHEPAAGLKVESESHNLQIQAQIRVMRSPAAPYPNNNGPFPIMDQNVC